MTCDGCGCTFAYDPQFGEIGPGGGPGDDPSTFPTLSYGDGAISVDLSPSGNPSVAEDGECEVELGDGDCVEKTPCDAQFNVEFDCSGGGKVVHKSNTLYVYNKDSGQWEIDTVGTPPATTADIDPGNTEFRTIGPPGACGVRLEAEFELSKAPFQPATLLLMAGCEPCKHSE